MPTRLISTSRQGDAHAPVAFRLHHAHRPCLRYGEIRAADTDFYAQKLLAQIISRRGRQDLPGGRQVPARFIFSRKIWRISILFLMQRGNDDMRRLVFAKLNDQIRQIGFVRRNAGLIPTLHSGRVSSDVIVFTLMTSDLIVLTG